MLAQGVDLVDARPTAQQQGGQALQVFQGQAGGRRGEQGRPAAGDQEEDQVSFAGISQQVHDLPGGAHAALIRDGVPGGEDLHTRQVSLVAVLDQDDALR